METCLEVVMLKLVSHGRTKRGLSQPIMILMWGHQQDALHSACESRTAESSKEPRLVEENGKENCSLDWVTCPVCSKSIKGDDAVINNHLGQEP